MTIPTSDPTRLAALNATRLLDSPAEEAFDRLTRLTTQLLGAPVSLITLVTGEGQFFKSARGVEEPWRSRRGTPLSHSFCRHVVDHDEPLIVTDAREHPLVRANPAIADLGVIAYAGVPLRTSDGHTLGTLCAIDDRPHAWAGEDIAALEDLAAVAMAEIEARRVVLAAAAARDLIAVQHELLSAAAAD